MDEFMDKKLFIPTILFIIILAFSVFALSKENENKEIFEQNSPAKQQLTSNITLFYSNDCPHCVKVENYIQENNIQDKVSFVPKNIDQNTANVKELQEKARLCGLADGSLGVPFLWDGQNNICLMGDEDIIDFFEQKIAE
jgi:glutaredoxin